MTGTRKAMLGVAAILGLLVFGSVFVKSSQTPGQRPGGQNIDPTADIHPSVSLRGQMGNPGLWFGGASTWAVCGVIRTAKVVAGG